ncbi:MAG TPA: hypothetical protein VFE50_16600 [Cyclobacteriaceae bacterium]|nr:hypothetical protein [Cyclobacteriaceae bacterium]
MKTLKAEGHEIVLAKAGAVLEPQGYKLRKGGTRYDKDGPEISTSVQFYFKRSSNYEGFSKMTITFHKVEEIIAKVGLPDRVDLHKAQNRRLLRTLQDRSAVLEYDEGTGPESTRVETIEDFEQWGNAIAKYLQTDGRNFVEKYDNLPAVLREMDRFTSEGKKWFKGLIGGGAEYFFRGLIISKLCNDPNYQDKVRLGDTSFAPNVGEEWASYYEKYKEALSSLR